MRVDLYFLNEFEKEKNGFILFFFLLKFFVVSETDNNV